MEIHLLNQIGQPPLAGGMRLSLRISAGEPLRAMIAEA